jgi:hypothetical protein
VILLSVNISFMVQNLANIPPAVGQVIIRYFVFTAIFDLIRMILLIHLYTSYYIIVISELFKTFLPKNYNCVAASPPN